jgi:ABC-type transport system, involved in lipoprotein release, permease component
LKLFKTAIREIKGSLGRYLAIFTIVIIGVGFFSGLSICKEAMITTANGYLQENNLYDFRVLSTLGFTDEDVESYKDSDFVKFADGAYFVDALVLDEDNAERVFRVHSISDDINKISLIHGSMPESANECVADAGAYGQEDIGKTVSISKGNSEEALETLTYDEYTIVGIGNLPYYMNVERGTSDIGSGRISAFICVPPNGFSCGYYQEIYITVNSGERIYSDEYKGKIEDTKDKITTITEERAGIRYDGIISYIQASAVLYPDSQIANEYLKMPEPPSVFVLTREANVSYVSFENDSGIVGGIAKVFPVFFFLVTALICITTMSRMVEEQRTQIGVLKSLGYGNGSIISKFFLYSGSSGILGCIIGYFGGTFLLPAVIWKAFNMLYPFSDNMAFVFDGKLLIAALAVTCLCTIGVTLLCCSNTLRSAAANLIRPKTPKSGKRTLLELITPLWNKLSFLHKVSLRNLFRYRQRFFMMIIGIGGCTALLVAGFGIKDSINNVITDQYERITQYNAEVSFSNVPESKESFLEEHSDTIKDLLYISTLSADMSIDSKVKNISVIAPNINSLDGYMNLQYAGKEIIFPNTGEVIINSGLAKDMGIDTGDKIIFSSNNLKTAELIVSGIFDNYIGNFAYVSKETAELFFDNSETNGAYIVFANDTDSREVVPALLSDEKVSNVSVVDDVKNSINDTMKSLNYIVLVVISCAGALAFVVLYNLTNINITERLREIASVKVLGFYDNETSTYIFRENNILTVIGTGFGLLLGKFLHAYVMMQVNIEFMKFSTFIDWKSYVYSGALTLVFAFVMQMIMNRKLKRINMAESLKTVE